MLFEEHPHRRLNQLTGEWVLVSPHRTKRPWQGQQEEPDLAVRPEYDPGCYLCPGNERAGGAVNPDYTFTFAFTNDFAALLPDPPGESSSTESDLLVAEAEPGICRVLCYSPRHDLTMARLGVDRAAEVVDLWCGEFTDLGGREDIGYVQIFENRGSIMGCSNPHPHGQIWATRSVPMYPANEGERQAAHLREKGNCLLCDYLAVERKSGERIIFENDSFVALVPFWALWPFETMILPKGHMGDHPGNDPGATAGPCRRHGPSQRAVRQHFSDFVSLFHGHSSSPHGRRGASPLAFSYSLLSAPVAFPVGQEIHGRLRDDGHAPARPYPGSRRDPHPRTVGSPLHGGCVMDSLGTWLDAVTGGSLDVTLAELYGPEAVAVQRQRYFGLVSRLEKWGGHTACIMVSTPGRIELGGNHTDHNNGVVLAGGVHFDILAAAAPVDGGRIRVMSEGFPDDEIVINIHDTAPRDVEEGTTAALVRGVLAGFRSRDWGVGGVDVCVAGDVPLGVGLSSSAAFEVCMGQVLNQLFNEGARTPLDLATVGREAENVHFGKPCGFMDQIACATQGILSIDFSNPGVPIVSNVDFDFDATGYRLVVVDTGGSHADLTPEYAAIPVEMEAAAKVLGQDKARGLTYRQVLENVSLIRREAGDRALLRLIHFIEESDRAVAQAARPAGRRHGSLSRPGPPVGRFLLETFAELFFGLQCF